LFERYKRVEELNRRLLLAGRILTNLVAVVLVLAGVLKLINVGAEDMVEGLQKAHLDQYQMQISLLAIACGILMLTPVTRRFGWLMACAYWGGAIVAHMTYDDAIVMPAGFMATLCIGIACTEWATRCSQADSKSP